MKLYDLELSGNCYKVRLFCALNQIPLEVYAVDYLAGEHKSGAYLALNPLGEIPLLADGDFLIRDSQAILIYLAQKHQLTEWWPQEAKSQALVAQWLSFAANNIARGPNDARLHDLFGISLDVASARQNALSCTNILDNHLATHRWLVGDTPTLADIACYPYMALMHQGGVQANSFHHLTRWMNDIKHMEGFITMPGIE
ncbi:glutathione S-transferase family protein [Enterovibrio sp. ZSDZ35]|uniref:Glutathione S-transferase family protein n=1 Tax=Enterovibrio qingdaonensis TaxID=2899818 RepID=A0ABT5QHW4_9GAMM|nr:glutathione S-transferase family protein [Enterovibrio sp. ZSDZ35]MDD1780209.1 glutathione S-transferase family protein [Enterovibrio sp. ZSDZ35]